MYDYNNKSNEKEVQETAPAWSLTCFFLATSVGQETGII